MTMFIFKNKTFLVVMSSRLILDNFNGANAPHGNVLYFEIILISEGQTVVDQNNECWQKLACKKK